MVHRYRTSPGTPANRSKSHDGALVTRAYGIPCPAMGSPNASLAQRGQAVVPGSSPYIMPESGFRPAHCTHRPEGDADAEQFTNHSHQSRRCMGGPLRLVHTLRFFVYDGDLFTCNFMKWNGLYLGLGKCSHSAICYACNAFLCAMSHMNGFHTHSVRLQCAIPICIHS